ncbi:MAG: TIGR03936 family radical SAM-associated protein [Dictyoglomaceae bacterium]|nr:TIGR03936 family radical SAM-associated protein [Dictyoglomaceae bacterium]
MNKYVYRLCYYKTGNLKYISFKDFTKFIIRALRRTTIPILYSQGYNPMPIISFSIPVPVGVESKREWLEVSLREKMPEDLIMKEWNRQLSLDVQFYECYFLKDDKNSMEVRYIKYEMEVYHHSLDLLYEDLRVFHSRDSFNILVRRGEKIKELNLKEYLEELKIKEEKNIYINVLTKIINGSLIRGEEILDIFSYKPLLINQIRELLL